MTKTRRGSRPRCGCLAAISLSKKKKTMGACQSKKTDRPGMVSVSLHSLRASCTAVRDIDPPMSTNCFAMPASAKKRVLLFTASWSPTPVLGFSTNY